MCGKGIHRVTDEYDERYCYVDYFCDIGWCIDTPDFCPHQGRQPCDCPLDPEDDDV